MATAPTGEHSAPTPTAAAPAGPLPGTAGPPAPVVGAGRSLLRRVVSAVLPLALLAAVVVSLAPKLPDLATVWGHITAMTGPELVALAGVTVWNLTTYWLLLVAATPGLTVGQALVVTQSSTAVANTVPAGSAVAVGLTYAMLGSWGFSKSRTSVALVVTGIWNNFAKLALPVVALVLLAFRGEATGSRVLAGAFGIATLAAAVTAFALVLHSEAFAARAGLRVAAVASPVRHLLHRSPAQGWDDAVVRFRSRVIGLVRCSWLRLTATTLVSHLSLFVVLLVTLRAIGVDEGEVGWIEALAVFAFVRLLTAIPVTPGGLGFVELGFVGGLTAAGGDRAQVVAAVLVYRTLTYLVPIGLGLVTYLFWRRNTSWLGSAPPLEEAMARRRR